MRLDSIPELPLEASTTGLQNLQTFSVSELKPPEEGVEETVVYFNTDSGLGIPLDGVTIQAIGENLRVPHLTCLLIIHSSSRS